MSRCHEQFGSLFFIGVHRRASAVALLFSVFLLEAAATASDDVPPIRWYIDTDRPAKFDFSVRRGDTFNIEPTVRSYGSAFNLTNATSVELRYKSMDMTGTWYAVTGSVYSITGGTVRVRWSSAAETVTNLLQYDLYILGASSTIVRAWGQITLVPSVGYSGVSTSPAQSSAIGFLSTTQGEHTAAITGLQSTQATVYAWGNHASAGYATTNVTNAVAASLSSHQGATNVHGLGSAAYKSSGDFLSIETDPFFSSWRIGTALQAGFNSTSFSYSVSYGDNNDARSNGVAIGSACSAQYYGIAIGSGARAGAGGLGSGSDNIAIGHNAFVDSPLLDTVAIGKGTATNSGWFHYRGLAVIDSLGNLYGPNLNALGSTQALNTAAITSLSGTQAVSGAAITSLSSTQALNTAGISALSGTQALNTAAITAISGTQAIDHAAIGYLSTTQAANVAAITALSGTQAVSVAAITSISGTQALNTAAISFLSGTQATVYAWGNHAAAGYAGTNVTNGVAESLSQHQGSTNVHGLGSAAYKSADDFGTSSPYSYINGAWFEYVNTTSVAWYVSSTNFGTGEGYCSNKYWQLNTAFTSYVDSVIGMTGLFHYCYLKYTSIPSISVYWTTNVPVRSALNQWVCTTSKTDRVLGAVKSTNNILCRFYRYSDGQFQPSVDATVLLVNNGNPDSTWQATTVPCSSNVPVNSVGAEIRWAGGDADGFWAAGVASAESIPGGPDLRLWSYGTTPNVLDQREGIIAFGTTHNLSWYGYDNDDNVFTVRLCGWKEER